MMAQYPKVESIGSRGSNVLGIMEVQVQDEVLGAPMKRHAWSSASARRKNRTSQGEPLWPQAMV